MNQKMLIISILLFSIVTRVSLSPWWGHAFNFSPMDAIALFSGAYFNRRSLALAVPLFSVWLGDLLINQMIMGEWVFFYRGWYWQYAVYVLIAVIGMIITREVRGSRLVLAAACAAMLFFIISNFGVWYSGALYPLTVPGLLACYTAGLPFFKNTLGSDVFFTLLLFAGFRYTPITLLRKVSDYFQKHPAIKPRDIGQDLPQ